MRGNAAERTGGLCSASRGSRRSSVRSAFAGPAWRCSPNCVESALATFAVHAAGAEVVPLNPLYTVRELEAILVDAAPQAFLFDAALASTVLPLAGRCGIAHALPVAVGEGGWLRWLDEVLALPSPPPAPDDLASLQYTGGTTGRAKGVMLTHARSRSTSSQREALLPTGPTATASCA